MNPYYNCDKLGWECETIEEDGLYYEFNILAFWKTPNGLVFGESDLGCSCPSPFENYEGETSFEIEQKLQRVGSHEQACQMIDSWNKGCDRSRAEISEVMTLKDKLKKWF